MPKHKPTKFQQVAKRIFAVRSFKGASQEQVRERFRLLSGLIRDVVDGKLSEGTAKRLAREVSDRIFQGGPLGPGPRVSAERIQKALRALFGTHRIRVNSWRNYPGV